jgi:hypothetical protein
MNWQAADGLLGGFPSHRGGNACRINLVLPIANCLAKAIYPPLSYFGRAERCTY